MAQEEILELLKKNKGKKFDIPSLVIGLSSVNRKTINRAVNQLSYYKEINTEIIIERNYRKRYVWI